jgi:hypothetical protein
MVVANRCDATLPLLFLPGAALFIIFIIFFFLYANIDLFFPQISFLGYFQGRI